LCRYLKNHPDVCFSRPKETHYFSAIAPALPDRDLRTHYLDRFFSHREPGQVVGEGTVTYLYSEKALQAILELNPDARFVAMVRNPLEMLPSYHELMLLYGAEDAEELSEAWALQGERAQGRRIPRGCLDPRLLLYADVASLGKYVEQLWRVVGRQRSHVIVFDDFAADTRGEYLRTLRFLGLRDDGRTSFPAVKSSLSYRSGRLHRALYRHPGSVEGLARRIERRAREKARRPTPLLRLLKRLRSAVICLNVVERRPAPLTPELRKEIGAALADDVARLGRLLDRDLGHWLA
jgi:hypothetical protein